ncbi:MAG: nucleotidyltransferase domain-containing protein [Armatimonadetes bacterium]|nr:nucleotidyltransferase domain-containing protein [Armatimonadota bacterium]MDW8122010.1 nucleotidyltransferase domain-containing protein [Armatimonadota bacterium]
MDRDQILNKLFAISKKALETFPEVLKIHLIGSLARGDHTGFSGVDLAIVLDRPVVNPLVESAQYCDHFGRELEIGLDIFLIGPAKTLEQEKM